MNGNLTDVSPIVVDIETAPLVNVRDFLEPPDLTDIQPPSNYVKQEAIDGYIEREKVKRLADFERACTDKAALDFNLARIVALGWWVNGCTSVRFEFDGDGGEADALREFWALARQRTITGYYIRNFDLPMMVQRSRYLGVAAPSIDLGRYARSSTVIDLYDVLTFNDLRGAEALMPRSVTAFAKRIGIPVTDTIKGGDIPALVAAGEWQKVADHCTADVQTEVAIGKWLGVIYQPEMAGAVA